MYEYKILLPVDAHSLSLMYKTTLCDQEEHSSISEGNVGGTSLHSTPLLLVFLNQCVLVPSQAVHVDQASWETDGRCYFISFPVGIMIENMGTVFWHNIITEEKNDRDEICGA